MRNYELFPDFRPRKVGEFIITNDYYQLPLSPLIIFFSVRTIIYFTEEYKSLNEKIELKFNKYRLVFNLKIIFLLFIFLLTIPGTLHLYLKDDREIQYQIVVAINNNTSPNSSLIILEPSKYPGNKVIRFYSHRHGIDLGETVLNSTILRESIELLKNEFSVVYFVFMKNTEIEE